MSNTICDMCKKGFTNYHYKTEEIEAHYCADCFQCVKQDIVD